MSQLSRVCLAAFVVTTAAFASLAVAEPCGATPDGVILPEKLGTGLTAACGAICPDSAQASKEQQVEEAVAQLAIELKKLKHASAAPAPSASTAGFESTQTFIFDAVLPPTVILADPATAETSATPTSASEPTSPPPQRSDSDVTSMERMTMVRVDTSLDAPPVIIDAQVAAATDSTAPAEPAPAEEPMTPAEPAPAEEPVTPAEPAAAEPAAAEPAAAEPAAPAPVAPPAAVATQAAPTPSTATVVATAPAKPKRPPQPVFQGDPLQQIVNIDFREMELSNVVALLAQKAQINVIAGSDLTGVVTANLRNVTLQSAIDTVLRMNGLGMVPEAGVYHIVPYAEAVAAKRVTTMVRLENAKSEDVKKTLQDVLMGSPDATFVAISTNDATNVLIIAGPAARVTELSELAKDLDISKPVTPTVTEAIKINNGDPQELAKAVDGMLSPTIGEVAFDTQAGYIIVTDIPVVIEQVRQLIKQVDMPLRQVCIDTMIIDALLSDEAQTGVDWFMESVQHLNRRGQGIGSLENMALETDANPNPITPGTRGPVPITGTLAFSVLSRSLDLHGVIGAEVRAQKARLLANPVVTTLENKMATINITQEIPYQEFTQGLSGPPIATTAFKDVGIVLEVTPRVTNDECVIADLSAKQSDTKGDLNSIPIEDKRETVTTLRTHNGQTVFIGGLRRYDDENQSARIPILGDIPVINALFKRNVVKKESTELLVFLTCSILPDEIGPLPLELEESLTELDRIPKVPNAAKELGKDILKPHRPSPDPNWRWRRPE